MIKRLALLLITCTTFVTSFLAAGEHLKPLLTNKEIQARIHKVAKKLNREYAGKNLAIITVMKGSICVTADLMRELSCQHTLDWIKASSYGQNGMTAGELTILGLDSLHLEGRDVLLIDDIFDTGNTLSTLARKIQEKQPKSLKTLVLLEKNIKRRTTYRPDYTLFHVDDLFLVGYGLDYKERYRGLPGVYVLKIDNK